MTDESKDTAIIARRKSFSKKPERNDKFFHVDNKIDDETMKQLNWNDKTAIMVIDKYIFINAHLSSKEDINKEQIKQLKKVLPELRRKLPKYDIVVAGDLNSYLEPFSQLFSYFPVYGDDMTTVKKRTFTQGQFHKAEKEIRESKDKIISTLHIIEGKISYITGE